MITPCLRAQKKELSQARSYIKSGKDYDKAEKLMTDLLEKDAANRTNEKIYLIWFQAVTKQYEAANEKLYLKQKYDTAAFFNLTRRLYTIGEALDTLDALPDEKGRVKMHYREDHARLLDQLRLNLYYGGTYHLRRDNYATAYDFFETYLQAGEKPLFTGYDYPQKDPRIPEVAYWAEYAGYKMQDATLTLRYFDEAVRDTAKARYAMQYACEAYRWQKDEQRYLEMLKRGFDRYPDFPYFFPRLIDYYQAQERPDSALYYADQALRTYPQEQLFLLAKSVALLNLERYDECIDVSEQLISRNDTLAEPYFNIATAKLNQALVLEQKSQPRIYREQIRQLYMEARPYMEAYRKLAPDEKRKWAPSLYRIYLNLNMGRQFEEIDKVMKKL
ncbi:MAG: hypothetical protein IJV17_06470 [Prevotella sp.]|nr:hypothetical protein [Prevotella sp.]